MTLTPGSTVMGVGGEGLVNALYDADDAGPGPALRLDAASVNWSSSDGSVVLFRPLKKGWYAALKNGTATVTGTYLGLTATATVTVAGVVSTHTVTTPDGRTRTYALFQPSGTTPGTPRPLVLSFHGGGGSSSIQMNQSQFLPVAERENFLVAFPDGTGPVQTWNAGTCCGYAMSNAVNDVLLVDLLLEDIAARVSVNARRVFSTGMSNGGLFSHRLGCERSTVFAAIAPVAGGMNVGGDFISCRPERKVSVLSFHGTTDDNYPYLGGVGNGSANTDFYSIPATIRDWLRLNEIVASPRVTYQKGIETCRTYQGFNVQVGDCVAEPPSSVIVDGVTYDGGGHAWPGGIQPSTASDAPTSDIVAAEAIWAFFQSVPLGEAASANNAVRVFPNPWTPSAETTGVFFDRMTAGAVLDIFTLTGGHVRRLMADDRGEAVWDMRNEAGESAVSGVYLAVLKGSGENPRRFIVQR